MTRDAMEIHPEVRAALDANEPVVALESTILAHGMPYPENVETARRLDRAIRAAGAVPATICVLDGRLRAGVTGKLLTPFLLARCDELSGGRCLRANVELVASNAELGARLARELAQWPR